MLNVQGDLRLRIEKAMPDVAVRVSIPKPPDVMPASLITVRREGGHIVNSLIDAPGIGIYCYGNSESEAYKLAERVAEFMQTLSFADGYADIVQETMASDPDTELKKYRWYLSYSLKTYKPKEV